MQVLVITSCVCSEFQHAVSLGSCDIPDGTKIEPCGSLGLAPDAANHVQGLFPEEKKRREKGEKERRQQQDQLHKERNKYDPLQRAVEGHKKLEEHPELGEPQHRETEGRQLPPHEQEAQDKLHQAEADRVKAQEKQAEQNRKAQEEDRKAQEKQAQEQQKQAEQQRKANEKQAEDKKKEAAAHLAAQSKVEPVKVESENKF